MRPQGPILVFVLLAVATLAACDDATAPVVVDREPVGCDAPSLGMFDDGCTDLRDFMHVAGLLNTGGQAAAVAVHRGVAYVADGAVGVLVVDACDPARMKVLATVPTDAPAVSVAATERYLYVGTEDGLEVVLVADPTSPATVATARGAGVYSDIAVDEARSLAYVADDVAGLVVYDVSRPLSPRVLGVENTPGDARGVYVDGNVAYVADARLGLRVVSVATPESPWLIRAVATPGDARAVAVWNGLAVVADGFAGLTIVDVTSPAEAAVIGGADAADPVTDVAVSGGLVYASGRSQGLLVFGLGNPSAPGLRVRSTGEGFANGVTVAGGAVFVAAGTAGIRVVDARSPSVVPSSARLMPFGGEANALAAQGNRFYVADNNLGMYIATWRGDHFARQGDVQFGDVVHSITPYEDRLYVCADGKGVQIVDATRGGPVIVGEIPGTSGALDVAIADSVAFTVRGGVTRPTAYDLRGTSELPTGLDVGIGITRAVAVGSFFAYFVQLQGKLIVCSLDPTSPTPVRWVQPTHGSSTDIHVCGSFLEGGERLFIANNHGTIDPETGIEYSAGVEVYDLSDPMRPAFETLIATSIPARRIAFDGDIMYVSGGSDGLEVIDVSDPSAPVPIGSYWRDGEVRDAVALPGAILLAVGDMGLIALPALCD